MADPITWKPFQDAVASHLGMDTDAVQETTDIYKDLGLDSLGVVSLGMKLYAVFKIKVPMSAVSQIFTLGDMFRIINDHASE
ncbi:MAG: acyl carrier protein [Deltaproteobacteria bacterium]|nr:acyl carrier protein [Deltaproteobacteria bacterium]